MFEIFKALNSSPLLFALSFLQVSTTWPGFLYVEMVGSYDVNYEVIRQLVARCA